MAIDVDGFGIFRSIGDNPQLFSDITDEINKTAQTLIVKQLKANTINLAKVRAVYEAIGADSFTLILDGFADPATLTFLKKLNKYHPDIASASVDRHRQRIGELARGTAEPAPTATKKARAAATGEPKEKAKAAAKGERKKKTTRSTRAAQPKAERALSSKALAARWDGMDRDD
ncbi:MAG: hypothetical protein ACREDT_05835 [Methylocella sp.]